MFFICKLNGKHNVISLTKNSSAQILLAKNIARENCIESVCLR